MFSKYNISNMNSLIGAQSLSILSHAVAVEFSMYFFYIKNSLRIDRTTPAHDIASFFGLTWFLCIQESLRSSLRVTDTHIVCTDMLLTYGPTSDVRLL